MKYLYILLFAFSLNAQTILDGDRSNFWSSGSGSPALTYGDTLVFTVKGDTFSCPLEASGTYDYTIYWGDGNSGAVTSNTDTDRYHSYASVDTYTVKIIGTLYGWRFNNAGTRQNIYQILNWGSGTFRLGNGNGYFFGCDSLISISTEDTLDLTNTTTFYSMFYGCSALASVDLSSWNTGSVTSFYAMFRNCSALTSTGDLSSWNTGSGATFSSMFYGCSALASVDLSSWNTGSVTIFSSMFYGCSALTSTGDLSSWNTGSGTTFYSMFRGCSVLDSIWVYGWDVAALTEAGNMFLAATLPTAEYDSLLINWEAQAVNNNVTFSGGSSQYSTGDATTARAALISDHTWTITDGGQE